MGLSVLYFRLNRAVRPGKVRAQSMTEQSFDISEAIEFNLPHGQVGVQQSAPQMVLPATVLNRLCRMQNRATLQEVGAQLGREVSRRLRVMTLSHEEHALDVVLEQLGWQLAASGLGVLGLERWGSALVMTLKHCPLDLAADDLVGAMFEQVFDQVWECRTSVLAVSHRDTARRWLVVDPKVGLRVIGWFNIGLSWNEVMEKLHESEDPMNDRRDARGWS